MASGFWVVPMTDRAREISAFITPMPADYQRLVDNALYGFLKFSPSGDAETTTDVFQTRIATDPDRDSVLGRRSYIDDIMIAAESWDQMCQRVEDLLEACDKWNLSISVAKGIWGMDKDIWAPSINQRSGVQPERPEISDRSAIPRITSIYEVIPGRFIEDYAIYASVLYELREVEFAELEKRSDLRESMGWNDPIPRDHGAPELKMTESVDER
ncbi:LOW QUALITY PROTEIN: reverse transcriptase [Phytophthora megakarya]|uniref:Reverse transcriptase n=1 Tax=Phytophthora megakarya TaxID=4795 RepID=A0A225UCC8_9STRA|nr:LOW QUALITY PROTEIN: reverse transcriptase [Phytophthora megakarya]